VYLRGSVPIKELDRRKRGAMSRDTVGGQSAQIKPVTNVPSGCALLGA